MAEANVSLRQTVSRGTLMGLLRLVRNASNSDTTNSSKRKNPPRKSFNRTLEWSLMWIGVMNAFIQNIIRLGGYV